MMYLILTLLVYQAESKYFLTEHEEGPVKHHLLTIQDPADRPVTKDHPKIGEGKTPGKGTERVLEKEKILMRDNGKTKLIPDERRQRINLWKRETKGWMRMSMINL